MNSLTKKILCSTSALVMASTLSLQTATPLSADITGEGAGDSNATATENATTNRCFGIQFDGGNDTLTNATAGDTRVAGHVDMGAGDDIVIEDLDVGNWAYEQRVVYGSTGADQTITIPFDITDITIKAWGGAGGGGNADVLNNERGGAGGFASGDRAVAAGQLFTIVVGDGGRASSTTLSYGGGGSGSAGSGGSGGGLSGVWFGNVPFASTVAVQTDPGLLLIAGGGGGASGGNCAKTVGDPDKGDGGAGGGLVGEDGGGAAGCAGLVSGGDGGGGTQVAGGAGGTLNGNPGGVLIGGNATTAFPTSGAPGGGGGGFFGGGSGGDAAGSVDEAPGGGGSGHTTAGITAAVLTAGIDSTPPNTLDVDYIFGIAEVGYNAGVGDESVDGGGGMVIIDLQKAQINGNGGTDTYVFNSTAPIADIGDLIEGPTGLMLNEITDGELLGMEQVGVSGGVDHTFPTALAAASVAQFGTFVVRGANTEVTFPATYDDSANPLAIDGDADVNILEVLGTVAGDIDMGDGDDRITVDMDTGDLTGTLDMGGQTLCDELILISTSDVTIPDFADGGVELLEMDGAAEFTTSEALTHTCEHELENGAEVVYAHAVSNAFVEGDASDNKVTVNSGITLTTTDAGAAAGITLGDGANEICIEDGATLASAASVAILTGTGDDTVEIKGATSAISGDIDVGAGDDRVEIHKDATFADDIDGGAHTAGDVIAIAQNVGATSNIDNAGLGFTVQNFETTCFKNGEWNAVAASPASIIGAGQEVCLGADTDLVIENGATVAADVNEDATDTGVQEVTVATGGTLSGDVDLGTGDDTFCVEVGGTFSGTTLDGGAGTDTLCSDVTAGSSSVDFNNTLSSALPAALLAAAVNFEGIGLDGDNINNQLQSVNDEGDKVEVDEALPAAVSALALDTVAVNFTTVPNAADLTGSANDERVCVDDVALTGTAALGDGKDKLCVNLDNGGSIVGSLAAASFDGGAGDEDIFELIGANAAPGTLGSAGTAATLDNQTPNFEDLVLDAVDLDVPVAFNDNTDGNFTDVELINGSDVDVSGVLTAGLNAPDDAGSSSVTVAAGGLLDASAVGDDIDLGDGDDEIQLNGGGLNVVAAGPGAAPVDFGSGDDLFIFDETAGSTFLVGGTPFLVLAGTDAVLEGGAGRDELQLTSNDPFVAVNMELTNSFEELDLTGTGLNTFVLQGTDDDTNTDEARPDIAEVTTTNVAEVDLPVGTMLTAIYTDDNTPTILDIDGNLTGPADGNAPIDMAGGDDTVSIDFANGAVLADPDLPSNGGAAPIEGGAGDDTVELIINAPVTVNVPDFDSFENLDLDGPAVVTLTGNDPSFDALTTDNGADVTIDPAAVITLPTGLTADAGENDIVVQGNLDGPIDLAAGDDSFKVDGAAAVVDLTDTIDGGAGNDEFCVSNGALVDLTAATLPLNFEEFVVDDGRLEVNTPLTANVTVEPGGEALICADVTGDVVSDGELEICPGVTVTGNLVTNGAAVINGIQINSTPAPIGTLGTTIASVNTTGQLTLNPTTCLDVDNIGAPGGFVDGTQFVLANAGGGIIGTGLPKVDLAGLNLPAQFRTEIKFDDEIAPTQLLLEITLGQIDCTQVPPQCVPVCDAINAALAVMGTLPADEQAALLNILEEGADNPGVVCQLDAGNMFAAVDAANNALGSLMGAGNGGSAGLGGGVGIMQQMNDMWSMGNQGVYDDHGLSGEAAAYKGGGDNDNDDNCDQKYGVSAASMMTFNDQNIMWAPVVPVATKDMGKYHKVGAMVTGTSTEVNDGAGDLKTLHAAGAYSMRMKAWSGMVGVNAAVMGSTMKYNGVNIVEANDVGRIASQDYGMHAVTASVQAQYVIGMNGFNVTGAVAASYGHMVRDAFTETGGNGINRAFKKQKLDTLDVDVAAKASYAMENVTDFVEMMVPKVSVSYSSRVVGDEVCQEFVMFGEDVKVCDKTSDKLKVGAEVDLYNGVRGCKPVQIGFGGGYQWSVGSDRNQDEDQAYGFMKAGMRF